MNDKFLCLVIEALNSDSVKQSINSMLDTQAQNIIEQICGAIEKERSESEDKEHKLLLSRLEDSEKRIEELESEKSRLVAEHKVQISDLEAEKEKLIEDYDGQICRLKQNHERQMNETAQRCREEEAKKANEMADSLRNSIGALQNRYNEMQSNYKSIIEAYNAFSNLGTRTKERLRNIFVSDTLECFLSACFEWDNVEGIWNYVKREIIEKSDAEIDNLHTIFHFMFQGYNARYREAQYVLISPAIGSKHDSEEQVILGIKTDGIVSRVCLEGYKRPNGKVICKALVEV